MQLYKHFFRIVADSKWLDMAYIIFLILFWTELSFLASAKLQGRLGNSDILYVQEEEMLWQTQNCLTTNYFLTCLSGSRPLL